MFYACIPLFSYMGTNLGQMPAAAALRLLRLRLRLRLEIPAADRGTVNRQMNGNLSSCFIHRAYDVPMRARHASFASAHVDTMSTASLLDMKSKMPSEPKIKNS